MRSFGHQNLAVTGELIEARRLARFVLILLWLGFAALLALLPHDREIAAAVLLAGVSTWLESAHGALAFRRLMQRLRLLRPGHK